RQTSWLHTLPPVPNPPSASFNPPLPCPGQSLRAVPPPCRGARAGSRINVVDPTWSSNGRTAMKAKGFTLIELLIVMALIGLLATIAIPRLANTKERAPLAAMKSDLRNLVTVQEP